MLINEQARIISILTWLYSGYYLDSGCAVSNHSDLLPGIVEVFRPVCAVNEFAFEALQPRNRRPFPVTYILVSFGT